MRRNLTAMILAQIDQGNATLPGIAKALDMPMQSLTMTLARLRDAGTLGRTGYHGGYVYRRQGPAQAPRMVSSVWALAA